MDLLDEIYNTLSKDSVVSSNINRYTYINFPDVKDIIRGHITLSPLTSPSYAEHSDGKPIAEQNTVRVDVFINARDFTNSNPRLACMETMQRVTDLLDEAYYKENSVFTPEYDELNKIYRETKSFTKIYYRSDYK